MGGVRCEVRLVGEREGGWNVRCALVEVFVSSRGVFERNNFHIHSLGDVDLFPQDGLREVMMVAHNGALPSAAEGERDTHTQSDEHPEWTQGPTRE